MITNPPSIPPTAELKREAIELAHIITPADIAALEAGRLTPTVLEFQRALTGLHDLLGVVEE